MTEQQQLKQQALNMLWQQVASQRGMLTDIDIRLTEYYDDLCTPPEGVEGVEGDCHPYHNMYEMLCALKFLRLLRQYDLNVELVHDVIYKYEGRWEQHGKMWRHVRGGVKHPGDRGDTYYRLRPFQVFILSAMFGPHVWIDTRAEAGTREMLPTEKEMEGTIWDWRRLCTEFTLYTPRKTAKTQLSAFVQFWFFMNADDNAECYCTANSADQSKILFGRTANLIRQLDPKEQRIRFTATQVNWKPGQFRSASLSALSAGGKTKDGTFAQLCSADEFGSAGYVNGKSDMGKLVSVIESSMAPRREPMTFISTTAGTIESGPFKDKLDGIHIDLEGEVERGGENPDHTLMQVEDRHMQLLLEPDAWEYDEDILFELKTIRQKINPMLGIVCQHSFYDDEISKARKEPEKKNDVIAKDFNVYSASKVTEWLKADDIRAIQIDRRIDECTDEEGWIVFGGLDFSKGDDLNGTSYLAVNLQTGEFFGDLDAYMSEDAVNRSPLRELFLKWAEEGWLHIVPGKTFDPSWPVNRIIELNNKGINFLMFGYDPYNAKIVINALSQWVFDLGLDPKQIIIPVRQNFATYNPAVNEFDYMVKRAIPHPDGTYTPDPLIHLSKNPMWPWQFSNCVLQESGDGMGNRKPVKGGPDSAKIDNVQMLLSALLCYDINEGKID